MIRCSHARALLPTLSLCLLLSIGGGRAVAHEPAPGEIHVPLRGDVNEDDVLNLTDAVALLDFLFNGGAEPNCLPAANANAQGTINLADAVFVLQFLFGGGSAPEPLTEEEIRACEAASELSFESIYEKILSRSCAFSSCHSADSRKAGLSMATLDDAYNGLAKMVEGLALEPPYPPEEGQKTGSG